MFVRHSMLREFSALTKLAGMPDEVHDVMLQTAKNGKLIREAVSISKSAGAPKFGAWLLAVKLGELNVSFHEDTGQKLPEELVDGMVRLLREVVEALQDFQIAAREGKHNPQNGTYSLSKILHPRAVLAFMKLNVLLPDEKRLKISVGNA